MLKKKKFYIIKNKNKVNNINFEEIIFQSKEKTYEIEKYIYLQNNFLKKININFRNQMFSEDLVIEDYQFIVSEKGKKILDFLNIDNILYRELIVEDTRLKYMEKYWKVYFPLLELRKNYGLYDFIGNYKVFRIEVKNKILNVVDEDIKNKIEKFKIANLNFIEIVEREIYG